MKIQQKPPRRFSQESNIAEFLILIAKDIEKPWFQRMWIPLMMRQMSGQNLDNRHTHMGIPTISVTSEALEFLGYEEREEFLTFKKK